MGNPKVIIVCTTCGSSAVTREGILVWNVPKQEWEIECMFMEYFCHNCQKNTGIKEKFVN